MAAGINAACGYSSGLLVAVYPLGAGQFVLNTLQIRENLGAPPGRRPAAAEHAPLRRRQTRGPLAELPADFDAQLQRLGYQE